MFRRMLMAAAVVLTLGAPAWADDANLQLFNAVQKQVLGYPEFSVFDSVHVQIDNGLVALTGKVTMPYKKVAIGKRVAKVAGVKQVRNNIDVLPVSQMDDRLRLSIARAIYSNANFWGYGSMVNPPIHVIVERGRVTLEGVVNNNVDRMLARSIASSFQSFGPVKNELKTAAEAKAELEKL
jgi:hyperosmotically inducible periplasmic protein